MFVLLDAALLLLLKTRTQPHLGMVNDPCHIQKVKFSSIVGRATGMTQLCGPQFLIVGVDGVFN
jgi:hypothetical protein